MQNQGYDMVNESCLRVQMAAGLTEINDMRRPPYRIAMLLNGVAICRLQIGGE